MRTASAPALAPPATHVDRTTTGTVAPAAKPFKDAQPDAPKMATAGGTPHATEIVVRDGETISGLAQRYKVPADVIMKVNGLSATKGLKTGQKLVIPAYAYSSKATAAEDCRHQAGEQPQAAGYRTGEARRAAAAAEAQGWQVRRAGRRVGRRD